MVVSVDVNGFSDNLNSVFTAVQLRLGFVGFVLKQLEFSASLQMWNK